MSKKTKSAYSNYYPVIAPLIMCSGIGDGKTTACVMAQSATIDALRKGLTLDGPTDEMECACPVLRRIAIRLNDGNWWSSDIERTEILRPFIPLLLDSRGDQALTMRRVYCAADNSVRVITPMRFQWIADNRPSIAGRVSEWIAAIASISPIVDKASALAARDACRDIRAAADAADAADAAAAAYAAYAAADAADAAAAAAYAAYAYADAAAAAAAAAADADADAAAASQRVKYRNAYLECFRLCSDLK